MAPEVELRSISSDWANVMTLPVRVCATGISTEVHLLHSDVLHAFRSESING